MYTEEIEKQDFKFVVDFLNLENAIIAFFNEKDSVNLGTVAVAVPQYDSKVCVSSILLGERNVLLTKTLAETLAHSYNKMTLVSTHFQEIKDHKIGALILRLAKKMLKHNE